MKKKICISILLFVIAYITFIVSLGIAFQEQTYLDITEANKQSIYDILNEYVDNIDTINRISIGSGVHSGELCLYYTNGNQEILYPRSVARIDDIHKLVEENGYDYENILMPIVCISLIVMFSIFIYVVYCIIRFIKKIIRKYT